MITLSLHVEDGVVRRAEVRGDLLLSDGGTCLKRIEAALSGSRLDEARDRLLGSAAPPPLLEGLWQILGEAARSAGGTS